jgi:mono/diheme cytochrome c family protein/glucose/arabinose dehydrogenase
MNHNTTMTPSKHLRSIHAALFACGLSLALGPVRAQDGDFPPQPPVKALSPEESAKLFQLPDGYRLELVLSEPVVKEPVAAAFDGNGRMYVAEMRSYMQEIDGKNEHSPVSQISMHWSSKGDGHFDKHTVFIDKLILPRMVLPLADGVLVNETDTSDIWYYRDTDGDGVADKKDLWFQGGPRGGNLEHQASGLIWAQDNWIYTTYNAYRLRFRGLGVEPLKEPTAPNGGQWGLAQDDYGKEWYVNAGGEVGPLNFQVPIVYGAFNVPDQFAPGFAEVWPAIGLADVQGGPPRFRPSDKTLNHFTATCGEEVYRGDRLPEDLRGNLLFGEPVGRLIRRSKVEVRNGLTFLSNPYEKSEFIRSTDPSFRPINMVNGPDGCLYIVDMYRGIIQEGNWVREGSYLRKVVQQYSLDKVAGRGRVWRLEHKDFTRGPQPKMLTETPRQWVNHLAHPNGFWRDTAQKLLVLRGDTSVVPALKVMARSHPNHLARIHALWSLEGLNSLDPSFVRQALADRNPQVRIAAIRTSETLYKNGERTLVPDILERIHDAEPVVVEQVMMTARFLKWPDSEKLVEDTIKSHSSRGVKEIGSQLLRPAERAASMFSEAEQKVLGKGAAIYKELCFACHGMDGRGAAIDGAPTLTQAPSLAKSARVLGHPDAVVRVLLHGLSGPVDGKEFTAQMVSMASNDDEWIANIASYVRNNFGNRAPFIRPSDVARVRAEFKDREMPWTLAELNQTLPHLMANRAGWKPSASHNGGNAKEAIDGKVSTRYDTSTSQIPGMWYQIELPAATKVAGLELDAAGSTLDFPRGYEVRLSQDGQTWSEPVASGKGDGCWTEIHFRPTDARFVRIVQTGKVDGLFWSIHELRVFEAAAN